MLNKIAKFFITFLLVLLLLPTNAFAMPVYIISIDQNVNGGQPISLDVEPTDRIYDVKEKISDETGIDYYKFNLVFNGKLLEHDNTLQDYSIQKGSTLTMYLKPNANIKWFFEASGDNYLIKNASDLNGLSELVNKNQIFYDQNYNVVFNEDESVGSIAAQNFKNKTINLESDIPYYFEWNSIGTERNIFSGTFDGNNKIISGLYERVGFSYQGLFGYTKNAIIKNVTVNEGSFKGEQYIGGIVGYADNTQVINCKNYNNITSYMSEAGGIIGYLKIDESFSSNLLVDQCINYGKINTDYKLQHDCTGGIVGAIWNENKMIKPVVSNSYNYGAVISNIAGTGGIIGWAYNIEVLNCENHGDVNGTIEVGGIVGSLEASNIINCFNTAQVSGGNIQGDNNYKFSDANYVGGIVGFVDIDPEYDFIDDSKILNSFNTGIVSSSCTEDTAAIGGIVGYVENENGKTTTISNCYNLGEINQEPEYVGKIGEIAGMLTNANQSNNYAHSSANKHFGDSEIQVLKFDEISGKRNNKIALNAQLNNGSLLFSLNKNLSQGFKEWKIDTTLNNGYPIFGQSNLKVTSEPVDKEVYLNASNIALNAYGESGSNNINYKWYKSSDDKESNPVEVGTLNNFELPKDLPLGKHYYFCKLSVENTNETYTTRTAIINVINKPTEITKPAETSKPAITPNAVVTSQVIANNSFEAKPIIKYTQIKRPITTRVNTFKINLDGDYILGINKDLDITTDINKEAEFKLLVNDVVLSKANYLITPSGLSIKEDYLYNLKPGDYIISVDTGNQKLSDNFRISENQPDKKQEVTPTATPKEETKVVETVKETKKFPYVFVVIGISIISIIAIIIAKLKKQ